MRRLRLTDRSPSRETWVTGDSEPTRKIEGDPETVGYTTGDGRSLLGVGRGRRTSGSRVKVVEKAGGGPDDGIGSGETVVGLAEGPLTSVGVSRTSDRQKIQKNSDLY